jgi:hypothetical protein
LFRDDAKENQGGEDAMEDEALGAEDMNIGQRLLCISLKCIFSHFIQVGRGAKDFK